MNVTEALASMGFSPEVIQLEMDLMRQEQLSAWGPLKEPEESKKCTCNSKDLFNFGCKCGFLKRSGD